MNEQNWDQSIVLFLQAALLVPDNVFYRQCLRGVEFKKFGNDRTRTVLAPSDHDLIVERIAALRSAQNWVEMDRCGEEGLRSDPWNRGLNLAMAEACERRGFLDCAPFGRAIADT